MNNKRLRNATLNFFFLLPKNYLTCYNKKVILYKYFKGGNMKENKFTKEMVNDYAEKLLIGLTEEEANMVLEEFSIIDETINKINDIEGIENIEPMTHCLDNFIYTLREDEHEESIPVEEILQNCDDKTTREVKVPKVVG